ncbi:Thiosulfate sulfurtransferase rhodanese [Geitlerinema sp. FC II]|nr:Thiosulfate sulfurtransferase rhodanese [Geitlerinema sp. FC II]
MTDIPTPLVSADWLAQHLGDRDLVIVDCRFSLAEPELGHQKYLASHIPGAFYLHLERDLSSPVGKRGGRHPLPHPDELAKKLSAIGITTSKTFVVAYDDSKFAFSARVWWLLRYLGHDRVAILDGGLTHWLARGYPVTTELPQPRPGQFQARPRSESAIDLEQLKASKDSPKVLLVDSRDGDRYRGEREPIDPVAGSIPGSVNLPWKTVTSDDGLARSPQFQRQLWQDFDDTEEVIVYCGSGVTACVNILSRHIAELQPAKLYNGGWSEWCRVENSIQTFLDGIESD